MELGGIRSPLSIHLQQWVTALSGHPDRIFVDYIVEGLRHGFRVSFDYVSQLSSADRNMPSTNTHSLVIDTYIAREVQEGRMLGPFHADRMPMLHINRMGVVPKGHTPGNWRPITDLSYPVEGMASSLPTAPCATYR